MSYQPHLPTIEPIAPLRWDIFCRVVDNYGDVGVCWRLCADLAVRGHSIRLWIDDPTALQWMAPLAYQGGWPNVEVLNWAQSQDTAYVASLPASDVWLEGFGCEIAPELIAGCARSIRVSGQFGPENPIWINLEYLSAEGYVERVHGLPSPVMHGPAKGRTKHFFYPGFAKTTGGLLRESDLAVRIQGFEQPSQRAQWLTDHAIAWQGEQLISLFCYEPPLLGKVLAQLSEGPQQTHLLVTPGRAAAATQAAMASMQGSSAAGALRVTYLPALTQREYDELLWCCDLNFVRGEDSWVRALWAGKPMVWQIYPQADAAHHDKLNAFLDLMPSAPASYLQFQRAWNGIPSAPPDAVRMPERLESWAPPVLALRAALRQSDDLCTALIDFVLKRR